MSDVSINWNIKGGFNLGISEWVGNFEDNLIQLCNIIFVAMKTKSKVTHVPAHPNLDNNILKKLNFISSNNSKREKKYIKHNFYKIKDLFPIVVDNESETVIYKNHISPYIITHYHNNKNENLNETLVIHLEKCENQPDLVQPPLSFYNMIINSSHNNYKQVIIVTKEEKSNPCQTHITKLCDSLSIPYFIYTSPSFKVYSTILFAKHLVVSNSKLSECLYKCNLICETIYCPVFFKNVEDDNRAIRMQYILPRENILFKTYVINNYICVGEWDATEKQIHVMLNHEIDNIEQETQNIYTEIPQYSLQFQIPVSYQQKEARVEKIIDHLITKIKKINDNTTLDIVQLNNVVDGNTSQIVVEENTINKAVVDRNTNQIVVEENTTNKAVVDGNTSQIVVEENNKVVEEITIVNQNTSENIVEENRSENIVAENTSQIVVEENSREHIVEENISPIVVAENTSQSVVKENTSEDVVGEITNENIVGENTSKIIVDEITTENIVGENTSEIIVDENTTGNIFAENTCQSVVEENTSEVVVEENTSEVVVEENTSKVVVEKNTSEVVVEENTSEVVVEENTSEGVVEENTSEVVVEENTSEVVEENSSEVVVEENSIKRNTVSGNKKKNLSQYEIICLGDAKKKISNSAKQQSLDFSNTLRQQQKEKEEKEQKNAQIAKSIRETKQTINDKDKYFLALERNAELSYKLRNEAEKKKELELKRQQMAKFAKERKIAESQKMLELKQSIISKESKSCDNSCDNSCVGWEQKEKERLALKHAMQEIISLKKKESEIQASKLRVLKESEEIDNVKELESKKEIDLENNEKTLQIALDAKKKQIEMTKKMALMKEAQMERIRRPQMIEDEKKRKEMFRAEKALKEAKKLREIKVADKLQKMEQSKRI